MCKTGHSSQDQLYHLNPAVSSLYVKASLGTGVNSLNTAYLKLYMLTSDRGKHAYTELSTSQKAVKHCGHAVRSVNKREGRQHKSGQKGGCGADLMK